MTKEPWNKNFLTIKLKEHRNLQKKVHKLCGDKLNSKKIQHKYNSCYVRQWSVCCYVTTLSLGFQYMH